MTEFPKGAVSSIEELKVLLDKAKKKEIPIYMLFDGRCHAYGKPGHIVVRYLGGD